MPRRFSPGHCCCVDDCTTCCDPWPAEYDVTISLTDGTCSTCSTYSTTYTLTKVAGSCTWQYDSGFGLGADCDGGEWTIERVFAQLQIWCIDGGFYIYLSWEIWRLSPECNPGATTRYDVTSYQWAATTDESFSCNGAVDFALTKQAPIAPATSSSGWRYVGLTCFFVPIANMCNAGTTATITAVP